MRAFGIASATIVVLVLFAGGLLATASATGAITVGSATVDNTGDEASVVVSAEAPGGSGIGGWEFEVSYEPAELGVPTCASLNAAGACTVNPGGIPGIVRGAGFSGDIAGLTGTVDLFSITANAGVAAGECSDLTISSVTSFLDQDGLDIASPALGAGKICVAAAATPTPAGTPAATPTDGVERKWGDADCNGNVLPRDGQALLRHLASQTPLTQTDPCIVIGEAITIVGKDGTKWGDWDCNGNVLPRDGQALLRHLASQTSLTQTGDCPGIGTMVQVQVPFVGKGGALGALLTQGPVVLGSTATPGALPPTGGYHAGEDAALPWEVSLLLLPVALALSAVGFRNLGQANKWWR